MSKDYISIIIYYNVYLEMDELCIKNINFLFRHLAPAAWYLQVFLKLALNCLCNHYNFYVGSALA